MVGTDGMRTKAVFKWLSILMIASLIFTTFHVTPASAAGRQAVVVKVVGDVYIKKAGGSRELLAYEKMTLNDGDHIRTAKNSSIILQLADRDDEVTIDANTELYISDLREEGGKKSKFRVWSGSVLSKTKSMFGSNDEYEIDTPNAVMGVRGTHFFVFVDPTTGDVRISVFSGIVEGISSHHDETIDVFPTFEGFVFGSFDGYAPSPGVSIMKPEEISTIFNEEIFQRLIAIKKDIDEENEEISNTLQSKFSEMGYSEEDLDRLQKNIERIVTTVIRSAVETGRYSEEDLKEIIGDMEDLTIDDIINAPPMEPYDSTLSSEEQERREQLQEAQERRERQTLELENRRKEIQEQRRDLLDRINQNRERQQQENEQARENEAERALQRYLDQLSDEEREKFEQRAQARQEERKRSEEERDKREERAAQRSEQQETSAPVGGSGGGGGGGGGSQPALEHRLGSPVPIDRLTDNKLKFVGGIVVDFGNNDIPSGVTLTVTEASANDAESAGLEVAGSVLNFQFSGGYKPNEPVQLTLPVNSGVDVHQAAIFHKEEEGKWMVETTSKVEDGVAKAWVNHFSTFGVFTAERTEQPFIVDGEEWNLVNAGQEIKFVPSTPGSVVFYQEVNSTQRKVYDPTNPPTATASGGFHAHVYAVAPNRLPSEGQVVNYTAVTPTAEVVDGYGKVTLYFSKPVKLYDLDESNVFERRITIDGQPYLFSLMEDFGHNEFISTYLGTAQYGDSEQEIVITLESGSDLTNPYFVHFDYIDPDTEERHPALTTPKFSTGEEPTPISFAKFFLGPDEVITIEDEPFEIGLMLYDVPNVYGIQLHLLYDWYVGAYDVMSNPDGVFGHDQNGVWQDPIDYGSERIGWTAEEQLKREYVYSIVNDAHLETEIDIDANAVIRVYFGLSDGLSYVIDPDEIDDEGYVYGSIELTKIIAIDRFGNETTQFVDLPSIPIRVQEWRLPKP